MSRSAVVTIRPADPEPPALRSRQLLYGAVTTVVFTLLGLAVLDGVDAVDSFGVDVRTETATSADDHVLTVDHPAVTRPALASPLRIEVDGLVDGETVRLGIERSYLAIWDHNAVFPAPESESSVGPWVVWDYVSTGSTLVVEFDARLEPAVQSGRTGHVALLDEDDQPLVQVDLHTRVMP